MDGLWEVAGACDACGDAGWRPVFAIRGRRYGRCRGCAVVRLGDRVAPAHLGLIYDGYYAADLPAGAELERDLANPTFAWRRRRLERAIGGLPRRLFEIGCGDGNFLVTLQRAGWDVSGSEHAETAEMVRRRHGLAVTGTDVIDGTPPGAPFPVVAAYHVLEHIYRPAAWVAAVHGILQPGGILHVQVPNYATLARLATGESWASWCFPQHVFFYTPATLRNLLERGGFMLESTTTWDPWHGPGAAASSFANRARRLAGAQSPWRADVGRPFRAGETPGPKPRPAHATDGEPHASAARALLNAGAAAWSRLEALVGRGAVVDVIARRA